MKLRIHAPGRNVGLHCTMKISWSWFVLTLAILILSSCSKSPEARWQSFQEAFSAEHRNLVVASESTPAQWEKALQQWSDSEDYAARVLAMAKSVPGSETAERELWWILQWCPGTPSSRTAIEIYSRDFASRFPIKCTIIDRHESWANLCFQIITQSGTNQQMRGQALLARAQYQKTIMHDNATAENLYEQVIAQFSDIKVSQGSAATLGEIAKDDLAEMRNPAFVSIRSTAGLMSPHFEATTTDGTRVKFPESFRSKVVLLDFWATWCGPCVRELPKVVDAYDRFHAQGLEVLSVSLDQENSGKILAEFVKNHKMTWPQIYDGKWLETPIARQFGITGTPGKPVTGIPYALVVDGDTGLILAQGKEARGPNLEAAIEEALAKKQSAKK